MLNELIVSVIAALLSLLLGVVQNILPVEVINAKIRELLGLPEKRTKSYEERIRELTESLASASSEVDRILYEMAHVARERQSAVLALEQDLSELSKREKELQERIENLEKVPIPAAQYFAELVEKGERRSAWRDYMLFGLGVLVSTAISIALRLLGF